jgi:hypothetical protein
MRRAFVTITGLMLVLSCAPAPNASAPQTPSRTLAPRENATAVRLAGSRHRQIEGHPTIQVVIAVDCSDKAGFYGEHSLDVECAVGAAPGETFHGRVTEVTGGPLEPGSILVDVDNREAKILPGRVVAASFKGARRDAFVLVGVAAADASSFTRKALR